MTTLKLLRKQNLLWESTLPGGASNLAKDLDTVLRQLGEDVDHKIGELSLAEVRSGEERSDDSSGRNIAAADTLPYFLLLASSVASFVASFVAVAAPGDVY